MGQGQYKTAILVGAPSPSSIPSSTPSIARSPPRLNHASALTSPVSPLPPRSSPISSPRSPSRPSVPVSTTAERAGKKMHCGVRQQLSWEHAILHDERGREVKFSSWAGTPSVSSISLSSDSHGGG